MIAANVAFVLAYYQNANFNLWEETFGQSFFTRAVQLQALTPTLRATPWESRCRPEWTLSSPG